MDWCEFERSQAQLAANAFGKAGARKSGHGGRALLTGLLTCGRSGRGLAVVRGSTLRRRYCRQHRCSGRQWRNRRKVEQFGAVQVGDRNRPQLLCRATNKTLLPRACHMRGRCLPTVVMRSFHSLRSVEMSGWGDATVRLTGGGPASYRAREYALSLSQWQVGARRPRSSEAPAPGSRCQRIPGAALWKRVRPATLFHRYRLTLLPSVAILKGGIGKKMLGSSYVALDQCQQLPIHTG